MIVNVDHPDDMRSPVGRMDEQVAYDEPDLIPINDEVHQRERDSPARRADAREPSLTLCRQNVVPVRQGQVLCGDVLWCKADAMNRLNHFSRV
jgi:hypothetical protein